MFIERLKEWFAPTQETIFKINEKALVGCKATDGYTVEDGKIKNTRSMLDEERN